jgi:hypothetical protein
MCSYKLKNGLPTGKNVIGIYFQPTIGIYDSNTIIQSKKLKQPL